MSQPVLFCFDGSDGATRAIGTAAPMLTEREAIVLSVAVPAAEEFPFTPMGEIVGRLTKLYREWDEYSAELATKQANKGAEIATRAGFEARALTSTGKPASAILRVADEQDVAMIVLGARRQGRLPGGLGSVSGRVARDAERPVLVIPASVTDRRSSR
jgi:nucleotide-binding universal stress UspA family protein